MKYRKINATAEGQKKGYENTTKMINNNPYTLRALSDDTQTPCTALMYSTGTL